MRIALVCPYHMFRGGGVQEVVKALQREYTRQGHYVKIITPLPRDYKDEVPDSIITLGVSMSTKAFAGTAWQWSVSVDTAAIDEVLEREKFDVMHFHEPWIPFWSRQLVMRSSHIPKVATMHGRFFDTMTAKTVTSVVTPYTKPMIKYFDVFTAVAEPTTEYFRTLSHRPVVIIPNGIDIKHFKKPRSLRKHKSNPHTILYLGRLEPRKGVKYLLRAYSELAKKHDNVRLLVAGSGVDENKLKNQVDDGNIPNVEFLGFVSDEDRLRLLHEADLYCSPAHYGESFGIVLLEAMAADCPIVAGDNVGYQSVLTGRGALSLVNPQDTVDFARRLEIMLFDEELRSLWRKWAAKYVPQFDYSRIADQYMQAYKQAIEHHEERQKT